MPAKSGDVSGGAIFGLPVGLVVILAGSLLAAIQQAVSRDELKLQFLVRCTPLNPATISYLLGAAGVKFTGYMVACVGLFPHLLLEVYFGYAGKHVTAMAGGGAGGGYLHNIVVIGGLLTTILVIVCISRVAQRALSRAVASPTGKIHKPLKGAEEVRDGS